MNAPFEPAPRARMSEAVRAALRGHYLMSCRPTVPGDSKDKRATWSCACRGDGGTVADEREVHRLFGLHLTAVRMLAEDAAL